MATCPDCGQAMLTERPHRHRVGGREVTDALNVERPCYPATTHRYRRVGKSEILCCVRCGQGKLDIVGVSIVNLEAGGEHRHVGPWCAKCVEHGVVEQVRREYATQGT